MINVTTLYTSIWILHNDNKQIQKSFLVDVYLFNQETRLHTCEPKYIETVQYYVNTHAITLAAQKISSQ